MKTASVRLFEGPLSGMVRGIEFAFFVPILAAFDDDDFTSHRYWLRELEDGTWRGDWLDGGELF